MLRLPIRVISIERSCLLFVSLGRGCRGHPGRDHGLPGIELSAGSLGQGLSVAVGMALAIRWIKIGVEFMLF